MAARRGELVALGSVAVNGTLAAAKFWGGVLIGSTALLADGLLSGLDVVGTGVAYAGIRVGQQPPDHDHRYGHGKFEYFAGAVITGLLFLTGGVIVWQAVERVLAPSPIPLATLGVAIALVSLVANEVQAFVKTRVAEEESLFALEVDARHDHADAAASLVVIVGLAAVQLGVPVMDPLAAIGVAVIVFYTAITQGRDAFDALVDKAPETDRIRAMDETARAVEGVEDAHALRAREVGETTFVDLHILVDPELSVREGHEIAHEVEDALLELIPGPGSVVVHVEPESEEAFHDADDAPPLP